MIYRFKTEKEFKRAFGDYWRSEVPGGFTTYMDKYLGQPLPENYTKEINRGSPVRYDSNSISPQMLVKIYDTRLDKYTENISIDHFKINYLTV